MLWDILTPLIHHIDLLPLKRRSTTQSPPCTCQSFTPPHLSPLRPLVLPWMNQSFLFCQSHIEVMTFWQLSHSMPSIVCYMCHSSFLSALYAVLQCSPSHSSDITTVMQIEVLCWKLWLTISYRNWGFLMEIYCIICLFHFQPSLVFHLGLTVLNAYCGIATTAANLERQWAHTSRTLILIHQ